MKTSRQAASIAYLNGCDVSFKRNGKSGEPLVFISRNRDFLPQYESSDDCCKSRRIRGVCGIDGDAIFIFGHVIDEEQIGDVPLVIEFQLIEISRVIAWR